MLPFSVRVSVSAARYRCVLRHNPYPSYIPASLSDSVYNLRLLSTDSKQQYTNGAKSLSVWQKLNQWMQPFVHGSKDLYRENVEAWNIRKKLKGGTIASNGEAGQVSLSRREIVILRQAHRDLLKALPIMVIFAVPLFGYVAPLLGYKYPKQLLPWQFWRADQKTAFFEQDVSAREQYYPSILHSLTQMDSRENLMKALASADKNEERDRSNGCSDRSSFNPQKLIPFFSDEGPAALSKLSSDHLVFLARSLSTFPELSIIYAYLPQSYVVRLLQNRAEEIRVDDKLLLKEGFDDLTLSELEFACSERGIRTKYGDIEMLRDALKSYLSMHTKPEQMTSYPSSLICHTPALLSHSTTTIQN